MTNRLKKIIDTVIGKKAKKIRKLEKYGIVFLPDNKIKTREGLIFRIQGDVYDGTDIPVIREVFCGQDYVFKNNINQKTIVIDMGMNVGIASLYFASRENVTNVYSFEPFTPTYTRALENMKLNPDFAKKIRPFNFGLGKENKTLEIPYCSEYSGDMSTTIDRLEHEEKYHDKTHVQEKVEIKKTSEVLSPIFDSLTNECVVLKIDTEGAEFEILESLDCESLLEKVDFIMMEFHFRSPQPIEDILTKNGFIVIYRNLYNESAQVGLMYAANIRRKSYT